ncbi:hypothetical protein SCA6_009655 [Theobroma cacao]
MMLALLSYAILSIASFLIVRTIIYNKSGPNLPPGPIALPIIGHLHHLGPFLHQTFHRLSSRYGPLIYLRLGSVGCVVASNPELAKEFLKTYELTFANPTKPLPLPTLHTTLPLPLPPTDLTGNS